MCFATVPITSEAQIVQKRKNDPTSKFIGSYKKKARAFESVWSTCACV